MQLRERLGRWSRERLKVKPFIPAKLGVLYFRTETEGLIIFKVLSKQEINVDFQELPTAVVGTADIAAESSVGPAKIYTDSTNPIDSETVEDLFYYDDMEVLFDVVLKGHPKELRVYPFWIAGYLQGDYWDILTATKTSRFGWIKLPAQFAVPPEIHMEFAWRNPYGTIKIKPYLTWRLAVYKINYLFAPEAVDIYLQAIKRTLTPEPKWYSLYGHKLWPYNFKDKMDISRPIPITATKEEIATILEETRKIGTWK